MANQAWLAIRFVALSTEAVGKKYCDSVASILIEKNCVCATNQQARIAGVQIGMSISQTKLICDSTINLRDIKKEQQRLQQLAHWAYQYTSLVCIYRSVHQPLNTLVLEIGGSSRLFNNKAQLLAKIKNDLTRMAIHAQLGIANTAKAAYVASANTSTTEFATSNSFIDIESLDISHKSIQQLQQCGFHNLGDMKDIPSRQLNQRFLPALSDYLDQLFNRLADPLFIHGAPDHVVPPEHFLATTDFAEPISNTQWIDLELENLLKQLIAFLDKRQWLCQAFTWRLLGERGKCLYKIRIALASKHTQLTIFKELTDLKIAGIDLNQELHGIELTANQLIAKELWVDDLFDSHQSDHEVTSLIDRLHSRLGDNRILHINYFAEHLPEEQSCLNALDIDLKRTDSSEHEGNLVFSSAPVWLLKKPKRLAVKNHRPIHQSELHIIHGPQRINEKWWLKTVNNPTRDYYIARQKDGRLVWIFYQPQNKAWYLHGLYG